MQDNVNLGRGKSADDVFGKETSSELREFEKDRGSQYSLLATGSATPYLFVYSVGIQEASYN
jgi:hypothetical protein